MPAIRHRKEMLSLTDMWKAAGAPDGHAPSDWLDLVTTKEFIGCVEASLNAGNPGIIAKRGKGGGTFAHWQIGLAYAPYLSPEFHMWCNEVVRERMEARFARASGKFTRPRISSLRTRSR